MERDIILSYLSSQSQKEAVATDNKEKEITVIF